MSPSATAVQDLDAVLNCDDVPEAVFNLVSAVVIGFLAPFGPTKPMTTFTRGSSYLLDGGLSRSTSLSSATSVVRPPPSAIPHTGASTRQHDDAAGKQEQDERAER